MYGVGEARRGVLPSPAPAAYCGQVNRRHQPGGNTAIAAQVLTAILFKNEDKPTFSLSPVLGSGRDSSQLFSFSAFPFDFYSDSYKPALNGLVDLKERKGIKMNRPAPVEISYDCLRFLITHNPTNAQLGRFIEDLKAYGVNTLVRVCAATYDKTPVEHEGIHVLDWPFDDGSAPPEQVVDDWLNLLQTKFRDEPGSCVAVHCVAGLGRAPVLVALALIECGMEYEDAVHFIRLKRRGAFNSKQLLYLENYKPKLCLRSKDANGQSCSIQ